MRVCIFGGRDITDPALLLRALATAAESGIVPSVVVCGMAPGADALGLAWAEARGVPVEKFWADWKNLDAPGAVVRSGRFGPYNARAGHDRNVLMGHRAEAGVGLWDGTSAGTRDMIAILRNLNRPLHVELTGESQPGLF